MDLAASHEAALAQQSTIASYFGAFSSTHSWSELCTWPPDVFALTNLVLDHAEAYRFAVSPPPGSHWPPVPGWEHLVAKSGEEWRDTAGGCGSNIPEAVAKYWDVVAEHLDPPLSAVRSGDERELYEALLTLHAMSDEACRGLTWPLNSSSGGVFEQRAWEMLAQERFAVEHRSDPGSDHPQDPFRGQGDHHPLPLEIPRPGL